VPAELLQAGSSHVAPHHQQQASFPTEETRSPRHQPSEPSAAILSPPPQQPNPPLGNSQVEGEHLFGGAGTIDLTEMVAQLTAEEEGDGLEEEHMPPTPPANTFDDTVKVTDHVFGVSSEELDKVHQASPRPRNGSFPHAPRSRPRSGAPSPSLPHFPQIPLPPSDNYWQNMNQNTNIWSSRPPSASYYPADVWSSPHLQPQSPWADPAHPAGSAELPPNNGSIGGPWNNVGSAAPSPHIQQRFSGDYTLSSVTPPVAAPPGGYDYRRAAFGDRAGAPPGLNSPYAQGASMARNLSSSSHIFDSSRPRSSRHNRNSWSQTPPNGQGG
jgi:hypothetical protein